jgi:hypothetical protein
MTLRPLLETEPLITLGLGVIAVLAAGAIGEWVRAFFTSAFRQQDILIKVDGKEILVSGDRNDLGNVISRAVKKERASAN